MSIDPAQVLRVAGLARLDLDAETRNAFGRQLRSILDHVSVLRKLPTFSAVRTDDAGHPALREDDEQPSLAREDVLRSAPDVEDGFFRVPRVLEE